MTRYRKLTGAILGGVTGGVVITVMAAFGVVVPVALAAIIAGALSTAGTFLAKDNEKAPGE